MTKKEWDEIESTTLSGRRKELCQEIIKMREILFKALKIEKIIKKVIKKG